MGEGLIIRRGGGSGGIEPKGKQITVIADEAIEKGSFVYGKTMPITDIEVFKPITSGGYGIGSSPFILLGTSDYRCTVGEYSSRYDDSSRQAIVKKDLSLLYSTANTSNDGQGFFVPNQSDTNGFVMDISNSGSTGDWRFTLDVQPATIASTTKLTRSGTKKTLTITNSYYALRIIGVKKLNSNVFLVFLHGQVTNNSTYGLWVVKIELSGTTYTPSLQEYKGVVDRYFGSIIDFVSSGEYTLFYTSGGYAFEMRFIENTKTIIFGAVILISGESNIAELRYDTSLNSYIVETQRSFADSVVNGSNTYTFLKIKLTKVVWAKGAYSSDNISESYKFFPNYLRGTNSNKIVPLITERSSSNYYSVSLIALRNYLNTKIQIGYFVGRNPLGNCLVCGTGVSEVISACDNAELPTSIQSQMYGYKWVKWNERFINWNLGSLNYSYCVSLVFPTSPVFKILKYSAANNEYATPIGIALTSTTAAGQEIKIALIE